MTIEKTLAEKLAENRANGQVFSSSKILFPTPKPPRPATWSALQLNWYIRCLCLSLTLYFISLYLIWRHFMGTSPFSFQQTMAVLAIAAINYFGLIWISCKIQGRLQEAGLQKHGWGTALFWGLILNPIVLGWSVPAFVLWRAVATRRRLGAMESTILRTSN